MITPLAVRFGHACNSSSTHSIILVKDKKDVPVNRGNIWNPEYGWEWFVLSSDEAKKQYFLAQIIGAFSSADGHAIQDIADEFKLDWNIRLEYSIDHQSQWIIPCTYGTDRPSGSFLKVIHSLLSNERVVVLGGNNNDDEDTIPGYAQIPGKRIKFMKEYGHYTCRESNGIWTLFDKKSGNKVRMAFDESGMKEIKKTYIPDTPELVDLKITDFCDRNCEYCYQGSTQKGTHASYDTIAGIMQALHNMQVFEVALGGGEPTSHPVLSNILTASERKEWGFYPTFTTRKLDFLKDVRIAKLIEDGNTSFAFSAENPWNVQKIVRAFYENIDRDAKQVEFAINIVEGTIPDKQSFHDILTLANYHHLMVILLDYKEPKNPPSWYKKYDNSWFMTEYKKHNASPSLGVDSLFAKTYEKRLKKEVSWHNLTIPDDEGIYSCYIDAVTMTMSKNSYEDTTVYPIDGNDIEQSIRKNFKAIQQETINGKGETK